MKALRIPLFAVLALAVLTAGHAQAETVLKIATLAPNGSSWMRVFSAWGHEVETQTHGELKLRFFPGGVAGDEAVVVRKMRIGQFQGGSMTSIGLGQIWRPVLVLQLPGLFSNYQQLDAVRNELRPEIERKFEENGYVLMGFGDVGFVHSFSTNPIVRPADLRARRPWLWSDDPISAEVFRAVNVTGVRLGVPEVFPALQTRMVDTIQASPLAVVSLQWFTRLQYMTERSEAVAIGATVISKAAFDALPEGQRNILRETGASYHRRLIATIRRDDDAAKVTLIKRGIKMVPVPPDAAAQWSKAFATARQRLVGSVYPAELLQRVERLAEAARRRYP